MAYRCNSITSGISPATPDGLFRGKTLKYFRKRCVFLPDWPVISLAIHCKSCDNLRLPRVGLLKKYF